MNSTAWGQADSNERIDIQIPSQNAGDAVKQLAREHRRSLLFQTSELISVKSNDLIGRFSLQEALDRMFEGTRLEGGLTEGGAITVSLKKQAEKPQGETSVLKPRKSQFFLSTIIAALTSTPALAQDDPVFEEILVTARKRTEGLQDIPLAITAFTQSDIRRRQINGLADVALQTAGFSFEDFASGALETPVIRGQAQSVLTNPVQNVATFVDGIYLQRGYMIDIGLVDMERIEILKGPQSALYGQNAFSGAISYVTRKPTDELEIEGQVTLGTDERVDIRGAIGGPIVKDILSVRVGGGINKFDGTWENNNPNANAGVSPGTNGNVGGYDNWAINAAAVFTPVEGLSIEGAYYRSEVDAEAPPQYLLFGDNAVNGFLRFADTVDLNSPNGALWVGELPNSPEEVPSANRSFAEPNVDPRSFGQLGVNEVFRATVTYELNEAIDLFYQFGRVDSSVYSGRTSARDVSVGVPDDFFLGFLAGNVPFDSVPNGGLKANSHEARISYDNGGAFNGLFGIFHYDATDFFSSRVYYLPPGDLTPITEFTPTFPATTDILEDQTFAIYAAGEYSWNNWTFNAEVRYSKEDKAFFQAPDPVVNGPEFFFDLPTERNVTFTPNEVDFSFITPRITLQYDFNEDSLVYITAARGAKAGGFNRGIRANPDNQTFDPEFNWTYEIGSKNTFFDGTLQLNAAAFYIDWSDLQINGRDADEPPTVPGYITNIGGASSLGFEIEGVYQPIEPLQISFAFSHVEPELDENNEFGEPLVFEEARAGGWCDASVCDPGGVVGGNTLSRTPKTQVSGAVQWTNQLTDAIDYFVRTDVAYQSRQFASFLNVGWIGSRTLVNASVGVTGDNWDVQIWAKNLFDKEYASSSLFGGNFIYGPVFGELRTVGITASYRY